VDRWPAHLRVIAQALSDWWDDWVNLVVINLIWVACWITVVLGPPATLGLYYVANRLAYGESLGPRGLLEGGRRYFLQSGLWMMLNLVVMAILVGNLTFYAALTATWADWLMALFILLGLAWLIIQFYTLAYLMEQERKHLRLALRNALFTAVAAPGYTLVVAGFATLVIALSAGLVFPLFLGGPCLIAMLGNHAVRERLETYRVRERDLASREPETGQPSSNSH
jgi:uncharacterized membrane protein YesL